MTHFWSLVLLVSIYNCNQILCQIETIVHLKVGDIRGSLSATGEYTRFLGVPYGLVNESNPFGPSVAHPHFENLFEANNGDVKCPQVSFDGATGTIQCLTLNIYVPNKPQGPLPVMVWIYGGAFIGGSAQGEATDPISLLEHDVIIVAINYRVGIYGFLCLDTPEVPGNQGLKDQTLALRWIQDNIAAFGGDVNKITLFGESAGGMSVNLHLFSLNEKLYDQAIIESGPALSYWMMVESNNTIPLTLAKALGLTTLDIQEAMNYLSAADVYTLVKIAADLKITSGMGTDQPLTKPCVEKYFEGVDHFMTEHPMNILSTKVNTTPIIIGHNAKEFFFQYASQDEEFFRTYDMKTLFEMGFNVDNDFEDAVDAARHFYLDDKIINKNVSGELINFGTDLIFGHSTQRMAEKLLQSGAKNVYRYVFSYREASHGDELAYLFDSNPWVNITDEDQLLVKRRLTMLWTNFAKYGNPTPTSSELLPFIWVPITKTTQPYLNMNSNFTLSSRPDHDRMAFWDLFYKLYGKDQKWYRSQDLEQNTTCKGHSISNLMNLLPFISKTIVPTKIIYITNVGIQILLFLSAQCIMNNAMQRV